MIAAQHASKKFGDTVAVDDVSFTIAAGETLVLLGTSGCGKTTTLKMINRLIAPSSGQLFFDGKDLTTIAPEELRRRIGYVIQHIGLFPHYTVAENVGVVPELLHWPRPKIRDRVDYLLTKVGLPPEQFAQQYPHQLSGGQQQRVGLARALAADPPVVLMDEPFGALDPITRQHIRQEFMQLDELAGKTIVLVTHDVQEAIILGNRICLMDRGRMQQIGTPRELVLQPANEFVRAFFSPNRFQLEMMVRTLADVLPVLSGANGSMHPEAPVFDAATSVWEMMAQLPHRSNGHLVFGIRHQNVVSFVTSDAFLRAYHTAVA